MIQLYDVAFETVGRTGRAPERWPSDVHAGDFVVLAVLTLPELPSPVFVISEPCTGFVLYSFLESGRLARVTVPFTPNEAFSAAQRTKRPRGCRAPLPALFAG